MKARYSILYAKMDYFNNLFLLRDIMIVVKTNSKTLKISLFSFNQAKSYAIVDHL